ncbi:hypothetical protein SLEP1_g134 [Rubroshorea leprosula]|uniref:Ubiquitin-like protease family profile domain-containing protein n=1 Tax=Rubroshorea leprosula TaxID=152421 RepID=A0AAV5HF49_9ROSI|nr:hypothetical protein SLEP1_g134 [Rubroshorea leprosula]
MGVLASNRKRADDCSGFTSQKINQNSPDFRVLKKPRISLTQQSPEKHIWFPNGTVSRLARYPEAKPPLPREVHAPCKNLKFRLSVSRSNQYLRPNSSGYIEKEDFSAVSINTMRSFLCRQYDNAKKMALDALRYSKKDKEVIIEDNEQGGEEAVSDDSSVEEVDVEDRREKIVEERNLQPSSSSVVTEFNNGSLRVDNAGKMLDSLSLGHEGVQFLSIEAYKNLLNSAERRNLKIDDLNFEIKLHEERWDALRSLRSLKKPVETFVPLTEEELSEVEGAFSANRRNVLVSHQNSNIDITGQVLQCLRPGAWLNDEVINVYLELLKERERREPKKFLKCHFFNTFFYKKLAGESGYNYKSVRRWTSERKLGYFLIDCDKIFVPIHKEVHWCLAVINKKDQKLQYLDSLKGMDAQVLHTLERYYVEEVKDKCGRDINISSWDHEYVEDLPEQMNGFDCGMFMLKYIDFYSRGFGLCFNQGDMPYFRLRTAKEILRLRAD